jgi:hypothetical protein
MSAPPTDRRLVPVAALASARARRWVIDSPAGPIALDGVGLTAAAQHGWALVPLEPAPTGEASEVRVAARRHPSALRLASVCICTGILTALSAVSFDGDFTVVGSGHFSGTLLPPAVAVLGLLALAAVALKGGKSS